MFYLLPARTEAPQRDGGLQVAAGLSPGSKAGVGEAGRQWAWLENSVLATTGPQLLMA